MHISDKNLQPGHFSLKIESYRSRNNVQRTRSEGRQNEFSAANNLDWGFPKVQWESYIRFEQRVPNRHISSAIEHGQNLPLDEGATTKLD